MPQPVSQRPDTEDRQRRATDPKAHASRLIAARSGTFVQSITPPSLRPQVHLPTPWDKGKRRQLKNESIVGAITKNIAQLGYMGNGLCGIRSVEAWQTTKGPLTLTANLDSGSCPQRANISLERLPLSHQPKRDSVPPSRAGPSILH
jgi:hypothetical protein